MKKIQKNETISRLALVFSGILLFQTVHSQEKYLPGYVINLKGDTLSGFIDYRNWKINPGKIDFKDRVENKQFTFLPSDIIEFKVKDEVYVSAIINIETSPRNTAELNYDKAMHLQAESAFLQTFYKGKKSLYHYFNHGKDYFYIRKDTTFELLLYKKYLFVQENNPLIKENNTIIKENKAYLGQLDNYLNDCQGIEDRLTKTTYKQAALDNLFKYYYETTQSEISFKKNIERASLETGALAGVSLTSLSFRGPSYFTLTDYSLSVNFSAGLYCELILPRNQRKWSISNELIISAYDVSGTYNDGVENDYSKTTTELGFTYLKINNLLRYKYPVGHAYIFLNGGISNGFIIKEINYKNVVTKFYSSETNVEGVALEGTRKYELGFIFGTGLKTGRYSLEARYETGNGMSDYFTIKGRTQRIFLLLGFRF
jgi:hypothetical protein